MVCEIQYPETKDAGTENANPQSNQSSVKDKDQEFLPEGGDIQTVDVECKYFITCKDSRLIIHRTTFHFSCFHF